MTTPADRQPIRLVDTGELVGFVLPDAEEAVERDELAPVIPLWPAKDEDE